MGGSSPALIVIGGVPGTGKTLLATHLSKDLSIPRLCSDTFGGVIREVMGVPNAFRAGYKLLFTLCDEFVGSGCSVVIDANMGWEFQWDRLDQILASKPGIRFVPMILRCPLDICVERIERRHKEDPDRHPPVELFMEQPQMKNVWGYLETLARDDVHYLDASRSPAEVHAEALRHVNSD